MSTIKIHDKYFKPLLKEISSFELSEYNVRCYKMDEGCHYRTHLDQWVGDIGCIYYINQKEQCEDSNIVKQVRPMRCS